ncbi:MAG: hypothetical protein KF705_09780 [Phycisphaeraceae bacterium]|nr:hypothetical protein [Phycisphaeraceae bacterium]
MNNEPTSDRPSPGVVHLAHTTPLSDAIQGRLTGRLDIALACDRAGLPPSIRELVLQTAQATRLWRVERADVAHELIAHFRDGIEAGRTPDELIAAFGESLVAARLIRRAKKQSRPLSWKLWILLWKSIGALLVLSILLYLILFIRYHTGSPVVKVNPIATLNAPALSIPTEERAWNRYKLAISAYTKPHDDLMLPGAQWPHIPADSPYRDLALATLEANRPALEHVHAAAAMPRSATSSASRSNQTLPGPIMAVKSRRSMTPIGPTTRPRSASCSPRSESSESSRISSCSTRCSRESNTTPHVWL